MIMHSFTFVFPYVAWLLPCPPFEGLVWFSLIPHEVFPIKEDVTSTCQCRVAAPTFTDLILAQQSFAAAKWRIHTMPEPTAPEIAAAAAEMQLSFDQQVGITTPNPELVELKKP